ncbi:Uncharacterized protein BM_BM10982 [Brugia malayi]|uniref:Uncharacterized protein n=1 Tax=Brugia malayi TaxID=6279 RepID=A0A4E9EQW5_BRUMA|nr:Uncharacterized protein BM_BM10982 [Brugia malayi]VIO86535.1 Uncharacterized protein BM_BM10982 [Brugia malayi]
MGMKTFDGTLTAWPLFWDWFRTAVHDQPILPLNKLTYLRGCLVGAAASIIEPHALRTQNYEVVITALKKHTNGQQQLNKPYTDNWKDYLGRKKKIEYEKSEWTVPILRERLATFVIAEENVANILGYASKEPYSPHWDTVDDINANSNQHET